MSTQTQENLRQHELVILRRLRGGPLTEFELADEIAASSSWSLDNAIENLPEWLNALMNAGLIWTGKLFNDRGQHILAAVLTRAGRELVQ